MRYQVIYYLGIGRISAGNPAAITVRGIIGNDIIGNKRGSRIALNSTAKTRGDVIYNFVIGNYRIAI